MADVRPTEILNARRHHTSGRFLSNFRALLQNKEVLSQFRLDFVSKGNEIFEHSVRRELE